MYKRAITALCLLLTCTLANAADTFPERKVMEGKDYSIQYSAGDEAYATALAKHLPYELPTQPPGALPFSIADLRAQRDAVLESLATRLGLPAPTPKMSQTFDAFVSAYVALQSVNLMPRAGKFALWRKPELGARLAAGQSIENFRRAADGGIEFTLSVNFQFSEGQEPKDAMARLSDDMARLTWPIKIGEEPHAPPDAEIQKRLEEFRGNATSLAAFQSTELQRLSVVTVLHEAVESTLVDSYIRSPDRRWFCEGVAYYLAYQELADLVGAKVASSYYDVDAEVAKYAAFKDRVDLEHWRVAEDAKADDMPADVKTASYAFATKAVFEAFGEKASLAEVLKEVGKTPLAKADMGTVKAAYRAKTGKELVP